MNSQSIGQIGANTQVFKGLRVSSEKEVRFFCPCGVPKKKGGVCPVLWPGWMDGMQISG